MSSSTKLTQRNYRVIHFFRMAVITVAVVMVVMLVGIALVALILLESMPLGEVAGLLNIIPLPIYGLALTLAITAWAVDILGRRPN